jgi:hypothetical protein
MNDSRKQQREIIVVWTLQQFQGLVEFEQMRAGGANPDYDYTDSLVDPFSLYGPITPGSEKKLSLYWLVVSGYHVFLDAYKRGDPRMMISGPLGSLKLTPGITLNDLDREARRQGATLSRMLRVGEMWVSEIPHMRIRVVFNESCFERPGLFWKWADSFIAEMERQGFRQQSATPPRWLTKQAPEQVQRRLPEVIQAIENWIPKQRFTDEEAYEAALAEYLAGQGIDAPEQQGMSLADILAAYGIGVEIKFKPNRGDYDRLSGQIMRQLEEFGTAVVLIIRPDRRDLLDEYASRFDDRVVFILK